METYCNPLNLPYRFQNPRRGKECFREAADPSMVAYQDEYWLFASKSGGYWHSADFLSWEFVSTTSLPVDDYAPDVRVIGEWLYFTASGADRPCRIYRTKNPAGDEWETTAEPFTYWDPNMFADDDGRVYLYWGCSDKKPIHGVEMDPETMMPLGPGLKDSSTAAPESSVALLRGDPDHHGWERTGENNVGGGAPWIEGPWMDKHSGRYYLQYAGPGTQFNVYGDGVYVGDSPLGPFTYAPHNPFSFKPGGFIPGAGHGSTLSDWFGNLWHVSTMRISNKHMFERRVGLFPAGFDSDGNLFCNTSFGDYPTRIPNAEWDPWIDPFPGWMLLSYGGAHERRISATASSSAANHDPDFAVNEDVRTYWAAAKRQPGEWLSIDLGETATVNAIQINFAEHLCNCGRDEGAAAAFDPPPGGHDYRQMGAHRYLLEASSDGKRWATICDRRDSDRDTPHDYVELDVPVEARHVKLTCCEMPADGVFAVSGLRVFGSGHGDAPPPVTAGRLRAVRSAGDPCAADLSWNDDCDPAPDVRQRGDTPQGYNVWWGIAADKLYSSWMVYGQTDLALRCLAATTDYWLRVDSYNQNGITQGEVVKL